MTCKQQTGFTKKHFVAAALEAIKYKKINS